MTSSASRKKSNEQPQGGVEGHKLSMVQNTDSEDSSVERRRVLLITTKPSAQDVVSELLRAMGYAWSSASGWNALAMLERESFDAILLDLVYASIPAEEAVLKIKEINADLLQHLLVIGGSATDPKIDELIKRDHLLHVSHDDLAPRLWTALQKVTKRGAHILPSRYLQPAQMIFDSMQSSSPEGIRGLRTSIRQFVYQHESITIDILLETAHASGRLLLTGQVLSARPDGPLQADLPVLLTSGTKTLARTTTDRFGEFNLEFEPAVNAGLEIRLLERNWVSIPLESGPREDQCPP